MTDSDDQRRTLTEWLLEHRRFWQLFAIGAGLFGMIVGGYGILESLPP